MTEFKISYEGNITISADNAEDARYLFHNQFGATARFLTIEEISEE